MAPAAADSPSDAGRYLRTLIKRLHAIPDTDKDFVADAGWAAANLSMTADALAELVEAGMPVVRTGDEVFVGSRDLTSASYAFWEASTNRKSAQLSVRRLHGL